MKMGYNKKLFPMFMTMFLVSVSCGQKRDVTETKKIASESGVSDHVPNPTNFRAVPDTCLKPWLRPDRCTFYRECLETAITCENTPFPYAISYGEKYCNKFQSITLTTRGEGWKRGATLCLQEASRLQGLSGQNQDGQTAIHGNCQEVRDLEFTGHVSCYLGGPARFSKRTSRTICALEPSDWVQILFIVEAADLVTKESLVQMKTVATQCLGEVKNKIMGISPPGPNWPTSDLTTAAEDTETVALLEKKIKEYDAKLSSGAIAFPSFQ
jgi:hypothetical protein